jgi:hypothetical protein
MHPPGLEPGTHLLRVRCFGKTLENAAWLAAFPKAHCLTSMTVLATLTTEARSADQDIEFGSQAEGEKKSRTANDAGFE